MDKIYLMSMMVCAKPRRVNNRFILSAYDGVWDALDELPEDIKPYLTDDLGNEVRSYGGFLQIIDQGALDVVNRDGLYACFRGVHAQFREIVDAVPPTDLYEKLISSLIFMGWDICSGNGWRSASTDGYYPINTLTGLDEDENAHQVNEFGLFQELDHCLEYCKLNNHKVAKFSPWYPVAVYLDKFSYTRLIGQAR